MGSITRFFIVLFFFVNCLYAGNVLVVEDHNGLIDSFRLQRYEDKTAAMPLDQVQRQAFAEATNNIAEGYSDSVFWYRFDIVNHTDKTLEYIVDITEKHISEVDLYVISPEQTTRLRGGNDIPYEERIIPASSIRFPLRLTQNETKTLYLRMRCVTTLYTSIQIGDRSSLAEANLIKNQMYGLYFGATLIFIFYTFFLYISIREKIYLYYIFYVGSFALWQFTISGFPPLTRIGGASLYQIAAFALSSLFIFIILFSRELLLTRQLMSRVDKAARLSIALALLVVVFNVSESTRIIFLVNLIAQVFVPLLFIIAVMSYRLGNKAAYYYLLAQAVFFILLLPFSLMAAGWFPYSYFNRYSAMVGSLYEIVFFSLALAERIKILKNEKLQLELQAKQALEKEVQSRTEDLINTRNELEELNRTLESRVKLEVEKNRKQQELMMQNSRLAQMGEMLNSIAHQWRQPLSRINSNVAVLGTVLESGEIDREIFHAKINNIKKNTRYMSDTIEDFANYFHPDKKKGLFHVQESIRKALELIDTRLKGVTVEVFSDQSIELFTYQKELQQVILIILNNAVDNFESKSTPDPRIRIELYEEQESVHIILSDNGGGIEAENINRIFEPYYTTKFAGSGTGLGLYVAKMLVEKSMNGTLEVENIDSGVSFAIGLPKKILR